jgi:hypothetical protein
MAHFYADIQGNRGMATRMGTPNSGINGHIRGWNIGVKVVGWVDENGKDCFQVHKTGGSTGKGQMEVIATIKDS